MNEIEVKKLILSRCIPDENGCLIWQGAIDGNGYASITVSQIRYSCHRLILKFKNGKWPVTTDHKCRNRACLNEDHLEDVSYSTNNKRMWEHVIRKEQKFCKRGHELTTENSKILKNGRKSCRTCENTNQRIRRRLGK